MNIYNHSEEFLNGNYGENYNDINFEKLSDLEILGLYLLSEISERKFFELNKIDYNLDSAEKCKVLLDSIVNNMNFLKNNM